MERVTNHISSTKALLPVCIFSAIIAVGGRTIDQNKTLEKNTSTLNAVRAKNTLTLHKIEDKLKTYELKSKD